MNREGLLSVAMSAVIAGTFVVACSGPAGTESVGQQEQAIVHICPEITPYCPSPGVLTCVEEDGCRVCTCGGDALQPEITLVSGQGLPRALAVDDAYLYWTNEGDGTIMKMPTGGGTPVTLASGQASPFDIAIQYDSLSPEIVGTSLSAASDVAWVTLGGYDTPNGTAMIEWATGEHTFTIGSNQNRPFGVAVDWTNLYWTDYSNGNGASAVMQAPIRGGAPVTLASGGFPEGIAVDAAYVYWIDELGTVKKVPIGGGTPVTIASGGTTPIWIAVDAPPVAGGLATYAYWTDEGTGTVMKVPVGGGTPTTLASGQSGPGALVLDSENVYWCDAWGGTIMKVPTGGGAVTTLVTGLQSPSGIAVDAKNVYYTDSIGGTVGYVAK